MTKSHHKDTVADTDTDAGTDAVADTDTDAVADTDTDAGNATGTAPAPDGLQLEVAVFENLGNAV